MRLSAFLSNTDEAWGRCCWFLYAAVPAFSALLFVEILQPVVTALMIALMGGSFWRMQQAIGTIYVSHFENAILCMATAVGTFSAGQVIIPVLQGFALQATLLGFLIPTTWCLQRIVMGVFALSRRRTLSGEAEAP